MANAPLRGMSVLVTRPREQADELANAIESKGGSAICFPVIEIVGRSETEIVAAARQLPTPDIAVFVSSNAVKYGIKYVTRALKAAIGPATASAIEAAGQIVDIMPASGYDSESLLQEPMLQDVSGKRITIVRGNGGRELLSQALLARGAELSFLSVYERVPAVIDEQLLNDVESAWRSGKIAAVTVMSVETLQNLVSAIPGRCLASTSQMALVTPATRVIKEVLKSYPCFRPVLAPGISTVELLAAIESARDTDSTDHTNGSNL